MNPKVPRAIAGGFVGTAVMTMMMYFVAPMMMGIEMDIAAMLGSMLGGSWAAGMAMHFVLGSVVFPLIYALVLFSKLPGTPVVRGAAWGLILFLVAQVMVMPMMGGGFFSANMGGMMAVVGSLMGHLVYGGLLGAIAGGTTK
jgi:uncharacterized membrane protein YagU involved in acid resistance